MYKYYIHLAQKKRKKEKLSDFHTEICKLPGFCCLIVFFLQRFTLKGLRQVEMMQ